jgi:hypothetical protein
MEGGEEQEQTNAQPLKPHLHPLDPAVIEALQQLLSEHEKKQLRIIILEEPGHIRPQRSHDGTDGNQAEGAEIRVPAQAPGLVIEEESEPRRRRRDWVAPFGGLLRGVEVEIDLSFTPSPDGSGTTWFGPERPAAAPSGQGQQPRRASK